MTRNVAAALGMLLIAAFAPGRAAGAELIMLEQTYCEWCERWNEEIGVVYHKTDEGKRAPLRRVNIHEPVPKDLEHVQRGRFTPTFVLIDKGREIGRIRGYPGEDFFWGLLGQMLKKLPSSTGNES